MTVQVLRLLGWAGVGCACIAAVYFAAGAALQRPDVLRIDAVAAASGPRADYSVDGRQATRPALDLGIIAAILSDAAPADDASTATASARPAPETAAVSNPASPPITRRAATTESEPTATNTPRPEPTATDTREPEPTSTDTPEPKPTDTPKHEPTATPTRTPKPTDTPKPTETPKHEPTATATPPRCRKPDLSNHSKGNANGDLNGKRRRCPTPTPSVNE